MGSRPSKDRRGSSAHAVLLDTEEIADSLSMGEFSTAVHTLYVHEVPLMSEMMQH